MDSNDYLFYWTLRDLCEKARGATIRSAYDDEIQDVNFIVNIMDEINKGATFENLISEEEQDYFNKLVKLYLAPKYWNKYLTVTVTADDSDLYDAFDNFFNIFMRTKDAYILRLKSYEELKGNLTAKLTSTSKGKVLYNDTPANSGDFADDPHTTNATRSENESQTDAGTAAGRLNEIDNAMRNVCNEWCEQWRYCFFDNPYLKRKEPPLYG